MSEEGKIFTGKLFDARTKELKDIKHKAHTLCQKFNAMNEYDENRLQIIREFIGDVGEKYYFQSPYSSTMDQIRLFVKISSLILT